MQTVLLVEDNIVNIKAVEAILEGRGYRLLVAQNGEQALSIAFNQRPALVLMDIQLPGMDGLTALAHLRSDSLTRRTKVIAVTSMSGKRGGERLLAAGFDGYLAKPFTVEELLGAMQAALGAPPS